MALHHAGIAQTDQGAHRDTVNGKVSQPQAVEDVFAVDSGVFGLIIPASNDVLLTVLEIGEKIYFSAHGILCGVVCDESIGKNPAILGEQVQAGKVA